MLAVIESIGCVTRQLDGILLDSMRMPSENFTIYNGTLLEDDPFTDPIDEDIYAPTYTYVFYIQVALAILQLLFCLSTIVSDVYLIVILAKFKNLRNRVNNLILLYAVFNVLYLILGNAIMFVISIVSRRISLNMETFMYYQCIFGNLDHLMITLCFYTVTFLAVDWYVQHYHPEIYGRYPGTFKYGLGIVFIFLAILKCISATVMCEYDWPELSLEGISFVCCAIIFVCVAILKKIRKPVIDIHKTEYAFSIGKIVILMSFPAYMIRPVVTYFPHILREAAECLFFAHPLAVLYLLGKLNKHFKMAYIKCCKRNVKEYEDDDLDSGSVTESAEGNVKFDKNSEVIQF